MKKIALILLCCLTLCTKTESVDPIGIDVVAAVAKVPEIIGERYKFGHNLVISSVITSYYAITDSSEQNQNAFEWNLDLITAFNIVWRSIVFTIINYYTQSYIPDHRKKGDIAGNVLDRVAKICDIAATTAGMLTYNAHYQTVIVDRYNQVKAELAASIPEWSATSLSILNILWRNLLYWYTIPLLLKRVNHHVLSRIPRQQEASNIIYGATKSLILAHFVFSLADLLYQHGLMSIKHTIAQFFPKASSFKIFRFEDCTICYLGTNMFGKSGPLAAVIDTISGPCNQHPFDDVRYPIVMTHTTQPYCGEQNPDCIF